jgi:hypothetical protein
MRMRRTPALLAAMALAIAFGCSGPAHAAEALPLRVVVPRPESSDDARGAYPLALLRLALDRSGRRYQLEVSPLRTTQARSLRLLAKGGDLDVVWTVTSKSREMQLRPIRIPIDRGLIGWRVLLVRRGEESRLAGVQSTRELSRFLGGQGHDWPDLAILRANGLRVRGAPTYASLFAMLARGHIDYFPRGFDEVATELSARPALAIQPGLLLHYPSAMYFFVNKADGGLADAIQTGLEKCLRDGSFSRLFDQAYDPAIKAGQVWSRRIIELDNPELPDLTPLKRLDLWYRPAANPR